MRAIHLRLDIRGAIRNRAFEGFAHDDGRPMTRDEAFHALCDALAAGRRFLPVGDCDNWDSVEERCRGHEVPSDPQPARLSAAGGAP